MRPIRNLFFLNSTTVHPLREINFVQQESTWCQSNQLNFYSTNFFPEATKTIPATQPQQPILSGPFLNSKEEQRVTFLNNTPLLFVNTKYKLVFLKQTLYNICDLLQPAAGTALLSPEEINANSFFSSDYSNKGAKITYTA